MTPCVSQGVHFLLPTEGFMLIPFHQVHTQTNLEPEIKVYLCTLTREGSKGVNFLECVFLDL